jgi:hypothetical protein
MLRTSWRLMPGCSVSDRRIIDEQAHNMNAVAMTRNGLTSDLPHFALNGRIGWLQ